MAVEVNSTGQGVEISWDELAESGPPSTEAPPGFPTHPIAPGGEYPDQGLPTDPRPDQGLPGEQPEVSPPIYLPPYIDNSLPGGGADGIWGPTDPRPGHPIVLPPDIEEGLSDEQIDKIKGFLEGNLPSTGGPNLPTPVKGKGKGAKGGKVAAVQVFAQGMDGDWSNTPVMPNDGLALLRYPEGFSGESYVEVRGLDGSLVDSGTITV